MKISLKKQQDLPFKRVFSKFLYNNFNFTILNSLKQAALINIFPIVS